MVTIVQQEDPVLRETATEVSREMIGTPELTKILTDMNEALDREDDGVAIAAPQIGVPLRIFIVSRKILPRRETNQVFINPRIKKLSGTKSKMEEGCLSVRWIYGETKRADTAQVEALNENGHKFVRSGAGILAQVFQHEMDHLDGVLFIDKAKNLQEIKPEKDLSQTAE